MALKPIPANQIEEIKQAFRPVEEEEEVRPVKKAVVKRKLIVKELPTQPIREYIDENGDHIVLQTVEEALTELINARS